VLLFVVCCLLLFVVYCCCCLLFVVCCCLLFIVGGSVVLCVVVVVVLLLLRSLCCRCVVVVCSQQQQEALGCYLLISLQNKSCINMFQLVLCIQWLWLYQVRLLLSGIMVVYIYLFPKDGSFELRDTVIVFTLIGSLVTTESLMSVCMVSVERL